MPSISLLLSLMAVRVSRSISEALWNLPITIL